jgi:hypothetical protein
MSEDQDTPQNATEVIPVSDTTPITPRQAADALSDYRYKRDAREERAAVEAREAPAEQVSGEQPESAAPPEEVTGETQAGDQVDPPLALPRSWAKDKSEVWARLDRETQEYLLDHDSKASTEVRRTQNEAAEQRKAAEAERQQLEQARRQYEETLLPSLLQTLQQQQQGEFADIKTMADIERLAREDWPRYALWDAKQKQIASVQQELRAGQERQQQDFRNRWTTYAKEQDAAIVEFIPELANPDKAAKLAKSSLHMLTKEIGFTEDEVNKLWNGEASMALRSKEAQKLVYYANKYLEAKAGIPKAVAKTVPHVQKPGTAQPRNADADSIESRADKRFNETGNWKDAAELLIARRANRR